jgi:hypothetical protein
LHQVGQSANLLAGSARRLVNGGRVRLGFFEAVSYGRFIVSWRLRQTFHTSPPTAIAADIIDAIAAQKLSVFIGSPPFI